MKKVLLVLALSVVGLMSVYSVEEGCFELTDSKLYSKARGVRVLNERYVTFSCENENGEYEKRIKDLVSQRETILSDSSSVFPFALEEKFNILIRDRYSDFYLTPDLCENPFEDCPYYLKYPFSGGSAIVSDNKKFWLIDVYGNVIRDDIECSSGYFSEGMVLVTLKSGECCTINPAGEVLFSVPACYLPDKGFDYEFSDGVMVLSNGSYNGSHKNAVMDVEGNILFESEYYLSNFSDGVAACSRHEEKFKITYGYVDKNNNMVVPMVFKGEQGRVLPSFVNGYANVVFRGKKVKVDKTGKLYSIEDGQLLCDLWNIDPDEVNEIEEVKEVKPKGSFIKDSVVVTKLMFKMLKDKISERK